MATTAEHTDFKKLKVQELRDELKKRDLDTTGTKPVLLARLEEASQQADPSVAKEPPTEPVVNAEASPVAPTEAAATREETKPQQNKPSVDPAAPPAAASAPLESEVDKARKRAERFGVPLAGRNKPSMQTAASPANGTASDHVVTTVKEEDPGEKDRRKERAKRFGMPAPTFASEEQEKRKLRAQRFEMSSSGTTDGLKARLASRKERFGSTSTTTKGSDKAALDKLATRAKRFGSGSIEAAELDAKKKARAERFAS